MASSEVEQIVEPLPISEVEGVESRYLRAEVEAAVSIVKSTEIQLHHTSPQQDFAGFLEKPISEDDNFLESSSDGINKVENQKEAIKLVTEEVKVPEILDKSGEAKREEEISDNGVQNSTEDEAIENTEIAVATTPVDKTDDITPSSSLVEAEAEAVPVENILPVVEMLTKEVFSDLGTKSNDDATEALDTAESSKDGSLDIVKQEEMHDESQTTSIGEIANEMVHAESRVEKEEIPGNDAADHIQVQEPLKEAGTLQSDDPSPDAKLQISPDAEREGLESVGPTPSPVEEINESTKDEELETEAIVEQGEIVETPQDKFEDSEETNEEAEDIKKETTETVDEEPFLGHEATQDLQGSVTTVHASIESDDVAVGSNENRKGLEEVVEKKVEKEASETGKVSEEAEQLAVPVSSEAEESSSGKLDDVITQEKAEIPKEDSNEDLVNENKATDSSFEPYPIEEVTLQKDEENVELSDTKTETAGEVESSIPRETEQNDDAARVSSDEPETITETSQEKTQNESKAEVTETDESTEKEILEDKEPDLQKNDVEEIIEQSSVAETEGFAVSENTKDSVEEIGVENVLPEKEHESEAVQENPEDVLVSELEIVTEGDKAAVVQKELPEVEAVLEKEADKESVAEEKLLPEAEEGGASVEDLKPEAENQIAEIDEPKQATNVTEEVHNEVAKGNIEESNEEAKENEELMKPECIEEMDGITKPNVVTEEADKQDCSDINIKEAAVEDESLNAITMTEIEEETTLEKEKIQDKEIDEPDDKSKDISTTEALSSQEVEPAAPGEADHEQNNKQQHSDTVRESGIPEEDKLHPEVIEEELVKENLERVAGSQGVEVVAESEAIPESDELHSQETEEKTRDMIVSQNDIPEDTTEEISLKDVEPREFEVDPNEGASTVAVEEEIKQVSERLEVAAVDESVKEEKSEAQHQAQPSALLAEKEELEGLTKTEELKEEFLETELQADREPLVEKVEVSKAESEAADVTEIEIPEDALKEEIPVSDEVKCIRDTSDSSMQTISDQALPKEAPEMVEDAPKQAEGECNLQELKVPQLEHIVEKEIEDEVFVPSAVTDEEAREIPESAFDASESKPKEDKVEPPEVDISVPETTTAVKEASAEDNPKQAEEELNPKVTQQVETDVQEIGNAPAETDEGTKEISKSLKTPDTPSPSTTMEEEPQQVSREFEVTKEESIEENESEVQPPAVIPEEVSNESSTKTEEMNEEVLATEGESFLISKVESEAANVQERENLEDALKQEIVAADDQEASDSTLKRISESNEEMLEVQSLPEEHKSEDGESCPEIQLEGKQHRDSDATENKDTNGAEEPEELEDTKNQTEGECKPEERVQEVKVPAIVEETQKKEVQDEVIFPLADTKVEVSPMIEPAAEVITKEEIEDKPNQEEEEEELSANHGEDEVANDSQESQNIQKADAAAEVSEETQEVSESLSTADSPTSTTTIEEETQEKEVQDEVIVPSADIKEEVREISEETPEDKPKHAKEAPAQLEEVPSINQVEPEVADDAQESEILQKGDAVAETLEETPQVSESLSTTVSSSPTSRQEEQGSRDFHVSELEPRVEKDAFEDTVEENESEVHPPAVIPEKKEHESSTITKERVEIEAANVQERENPEVELKQEIVASDSTLKTIAEPNEAAQEVQSLPEEHKSEDGESYPEIQMEGIKNTDKKTAEEPEVLEECKQEEGVEEVKVPEVEAESHKQEVQDEVIIPLADVKEEAIRIPEPAAEVISKEIPEDKPKQEEKEEEEELSVNHEEAEVKNENQEIENLPKVDAATEVAEETHEVSESLSTSDSPTLTTFEETQEKEVQDEVIVPSADIKEEVSEVSEEAPEEKAKQAKEAPAQEEEVLSMKQVEPEVANDVVEESENLQKGDSAAESVEETPQVSESLSTTVSPSPTSRQEEQGSRDFQVSELEPRVETSTFESKEANHTEIKEVSEVVTKSDSQETEGIVEKELSSLQTLLVEEPERQSHQTPEIKPEDSETSESVLVKELELVPKISDEESLLKKDSTVESGLAKEVQQENDASEFEFQGFKVEKEDTDDSYQPLPEEKPEQGAHVPPAVLPEEHKEASESLGKKPSGITTETANETSESALEVSPHQEVITNPEDKVVNETQQEESTAEQVIKEKNIIQVCSPAEERKESQPESEEKAERISDGEITQPKERQSKELNLQPKNPDETTTSILGEPFVEKETVSKEINIPSEELGKIVEEEQTKLKSEEQSSQAITEAINAAETTTVIDKELDTHISQRDQEAETVNPAKISLFDMMQQSTRVTQLDLDSEPEDKEQKAITTGDETKAEAEKAKSDEEKEEDDENEEQHKNDSGSDGLVIVEAVSKETETAVKVVSPKKKSHNILSEVGSKVKHSISKVKKVITGKSSSSNHTKPNSS